MNGPVAQAMAALKDIERFIVADDHPAALARLIEYGNRQFEAGFGEGFGEGGAHVRGG